MSEPTERVIDLRGRVNVHGVDEVLLDGVESIAICPDCDALVWIASPDIPELSEQDAELYLMRLCDTPVEDCVRCSRAAEAVMEDD